MRLSSLASARPAYYDRNATSVFLSYAQALAPHATPTTRWTYTVPSGKKLLIEYTASRLWRQTVATAVNQYATENYVTNGTNTATISARYSYDNTTTVINDDIRSCNLTLYPGEIVYASTVDNSTGGTVYYQTSAKGTLYDA